VNLLHNGQQDLVELEGGGERLAELVEDSDFAGGAQVSGDGRIPAALYTLKILRTLQDSPSVDCWFESRATGNGQLISGDYTQDAEAGAILLRRGCDRKVA
jgi:hypothetical protein